MTYTILAVGDRYTIDLHDGLIQFEALATGGPILRIAMKNLTGNEIHNYKKGKVKFRLATDSGAIITLWKFGDEPWIDAPYNALLARATGYNAEIPVVEPNMGLSINLHLIDSANNILRVIRFFALSTKKSNQLLEAMKNQIENPGDFGVGIDRMMQKSAEELANLTR